MSQVRIAGALAHHGTGHQQVDHAGVRGTGSHFHHGIRLSGHSGVFQIQVFHFCFTGGTGFHSEAQVGQTIHILILVRFSLGHYNYLCVFTVGIGGCHGLLHLIGEGHAVPDTVDVVVPIDFDELYVHVDRLCECSCHVGVETDPLAVFILVVHGFKVGDTHNQLALVLNIGQIAFSARLGSGTGCRTCSACGRTAAGSQDTGGSCHTGSCQELTTRNELFHNDLLLRSI